jgi:hypothetical protein
VPIHTLVDRDNHGSEDGMEEYWQDDGAMDSPFDEPKSEWPSGRAISPVYRESTEYFHLRGLCRDVRANGIVGLRWWCLPLVAPS